MKKFAPFIILAVALCMFYTGFNWTINRIYVPEGKSLLLRYKGPLLFGSSKMAKPGHWAEEGEVGVLAKLRGPGRHFYCPVWWDRKIVDDILIKPMQLGIVTCKLGEPLPDNQFLVDGELGETKNKGVLRKVLGPGRYRINPYGYEVSIIQPETVAPNLMSSKKFSGWVSIPTSYVGVVTNLTDNPITKQTSGIQDKVLPPGIYPINPKEQQIDIVNVGYRETSISIETPAVSNDGKEQEIIKGGINFPSSDGFNIFMDFTAIWGLMPDQAPNAIRKFGNLESVEKKVVLPQVESICRNNGSEYSAVQLLVGQEREIFQNKTLEEFRSILSEKDITLFYGLVRHIYIPKEVRIPIQASFIADELKITREQDQLTKKEEAIFEEAKKRVEFEKARIAAETAKLVAEKMAEGEKTVGVNSAETRKMEAAVQKETELLKAESVLIMAKTEAEGQQLIEEAKASKFKLAVQAFGNPEAYNNWTFATNLPDKIDIRLIYAGTGTLWTDLKSSINLMVNPESK